MAEELPPVKLAFVIDGEVVDILFTDNRLAAIFLSEPTIVDVTELIETEGKGSVLVGSAYDPETNKFSHPSTVV
jgi:hypothetical protein